MGLLALCVWATVYTVIALTTEVLYCRCTSDHTVYSQQTVLGVESTCPAYQVTRTQSRHLVRFVILAAALFPVARRYTLHPHPVWPKLKIVRISEPVRSVTLCLMSMFQIKYTTNCNIALSIRACLDQILIAIRLLTILCDHIRLKTGLIAIMQLIAKLWMIYVSLHSRVGLSEYQLSLPPHSA